jgi:uncharacterized protein (TIGR02588 family)
MRSNGDGGAQDQRAGREADRDDSQERSGRTVAEWTTLSISVILILGLVALVTYVSISGGNQPPIVEARPLDQEIRHEGATHYLPVVVTNRGGRTAQEVLIMAELVRGEEPPETAEFTIDFLAGGETMEGTVVFASDPSAGELTARVVSFR